jgi:hypothetical protein
MTKQEALEVKDVLLQIRGSIPATYVDRIFHYYKSYVDPNMVKPCTCQPKYWNQMLEGLRNKVESTLASYEEKERSTITLTGTDIQDGNRPDEGVHAGRKGKKSKTTNA